MESESEPLTGPFLKEGANIPPQWIIDDNPADYKIVVPSRTQLGKFYNVLIIKETNQAFCSCKGFEFNHKCSHIEYLNGISIKGAKRKGMQGTQLESYHKFTEDELAAKEKIVYQLLKAKGPLTDRAMSKELNWTINRICGRRNKLVEKDMVQETGKVWDGETKRHVIIWRIKP